MEKGGDSTVQYVLEGPRRKQRFTKKVEKVKECHKLKTETRKDGVRIEQME